MRVTRLRNRHTWTRIGRRSGLLGRCAGLMALTAALASGCASSTEGGAGQDPSPSSAGPPVTASESASPATGEPYVGYPDSIVVLGHSGSTGESSDPEQPGVEVRENSWATGTNPAVNSLYLRLLAVHPAIEGHALGLSQGGADVAQLKLQAENAVTQAPPNPLVVIQIMDNDMICPATAADLDAFQAALSDALSVLDSGLPTARLFVVSQFGSPSTQWDEYTVAQRRDFAAGMGSGPCAFLDTDGQLVPRELQRLEDVIHGYEKRLEAACAELERCVYDGGAFGDAEDRATYIAPDLNHFSVAGHAAAAEIAWKALTRAGLAPAT